MKKMNEKRRLREKVQGRIRGFVALMLAMVVAVGFMPMQSVKAADDDVYYLICCEEYTVSGASQFLGKGSASLETDLSHVVYTGYYRAESGVDIIYYPTTYTGQEKGTWIVGDNKLTEVQNMKVGQSYEFKVLKDDTKLIFGNWKSGTTMGVVFGTTLILQKGKGFNDNSIKLSAGTYKIKYLNNASSGNDNEFEITKLIKEISLSSTSLEFKEGDSAKTLTVTPSEAKVNWTSSNTAVAKVSDSGEVTAVGAGTAVIKATLVDDETVSAECTVTVKASGEDKKDSADSSDYKKDDVLKDEKGNDTGYVVANPSKTNFQAQYKGTAQDKNASKVVIQDEIKDANGNVFKVTMISDGALENAQGKELVIGKNVKKIGNRALKGAKFKKITFRTNKKGRIQIGRNAFRVKSKKCTVKVKGAKGRYQKLLKNKILKQSSKGVSVKF